MNSKLEKTLRKERQLKDVTVASYKSTFNTMARRYGVHYLSATWAKKNLDQNSLPTYFPKLRFAK